MTSADWKQVKLFGYYRKSEYSVQILLDSSSHILEQAAYKKGVHEEVDSFACHTINFLIEMEAKDRLEKIVSLVEQMKEIVKEYYTSFEYAHFTIENNNLKVICNAQQMNGYEDINDVMKYEVLIGDAALKQYMCENEILNMTLQASLWNEVSE